MDIFGFVYYIILLHIPGLLKNTRTKTISTGKNHIKKELEVGPFCGDTFKF